MHAKTVLAEHYGGAIEPPGSVKMWNLEKHTCQKLKILR